jgi:sec-independent protein translocase protein TatB
VFNLSGSEIVVILLLALVVLGPEKLPDAIRKFGRTYAELKKMGTGFQQEFKSAIDEPMREMRETADLLKKSADFSTTTAKPDVPTGATTKPVTDTVTDRPVRNESVAPGEPDTVPTDDVPFTDDDAVDVPSDDVPFTDHADADDNDVPFTDDDAVDVPTDDVPAVAGPSDGQTDRGEADDG